MSADTTTTKGTNAGDGERNRRRARGQRQKPPAAETSRPVRDDAFDVFGRDPAVLEGMRPGLERLLDRWFRLHIEGRLDVPDDARVIFVANHGGALPWDALVLLAALERHTGRGLRPLVEDPVVTAPFLGTLMSRLGCVRASQENATRLLEEGERVLVFPEGMQGLGKTIGRRHRLQRFGRGGFVRLAVRTRALLVPVAVVGGEETAPLFARVEALRALLPDTAPWFPITPVVPLPAKWRLRIGEPIDAAKLVKDESDAVGINAVAATIRQRLQKDVDELVEARGATFW